MIFWLWACSPAPSEFPTCNIEAPSSLPLHTSGRDLLDAAGRRVFLRGANTGGRSKFSPYLPFDGGNDPEAAMNEYLDHLQDWGFTTLRVPFSWAAEEPIEGQVNSDWLTSYDALLEGAAQRDLWTIVDFHQDIYGEFYCGDGFPRWTVPNPGEDHHDCDDWFWAYSSNPDVASAFDAFWAEDSTVMPAFERMWDRMASRYAGSPGVIGFEVINEPSSGTLDEKSWGSSVLTPFYTHMAARIQEQAPESLVFLDSTGLSAATSNPPLSRPDGDNLVFAPHSYDPSIFLGNGDLVLDQVEVRLQKWDTLGDEWDMPLLIGEFGGPAERDQLAPFLQKHFDVLDSLQGHGTLWEVSASTELWNGEDFSLLAPDGSEREELLSAVVRPYPRAIAEKDPSATFWQWDGHVLELRYDGIAGGVTEVVLPAFLFGAGAKVEGSGGCYQIEDGRMRVLANGGAVRITVSPE